jgi:hypothetical protein
MTSNANRKISFKFMIEFWLFTATVLTSACSVVSAVVYDDGYHAFLYITAAFIFNISGYMIRKGNNKSLI